MQTVNFQAGNVLRFALLFSTEISYLFYLSNPAVGMKAHLGTP